MRIERIVPLRRRLVGRKGFQHPERSCLVSRSVMDAFWMRKALKVAERGAQEGEVPVGAVLVRNGVLLAQAHNRIEEWNDGLAHAEMLVLHQASALLGRRLMDCTLYVTLEPCVMCAGAMVHARLGRLVFGATDPKRGGVISQFSILSHGETLHHVSVTSGIGSEEGRKILQDFFRARR